MNTKRNILDLQKRQLKLEIESIRLAIQHGAVKGAEAELAFRRFLRKHLPQRYKLSSGFVVNGNSVSSQHDIVVYDDLLNSPLYFEGGSGSFLGGAVYGVIETTIVKLGKQKLEQDIEKIAALRRMFPAGKMDFQKVISRPIIGEDELKENIEYTLQSGQSIVEEVVISSPPRPRTFLCALDGADYGSVENLSQVVWELTKKHDAHIHGLLVLNSNCPDWLLATKAFSNYEVDIIQEDALYRFVENMRRSFQGMYVGKYPAADVELC
ncbi:MAG: hypothetical protein A4E71_00510 [Smithella sp. PtaU1.Bin162]|nr:MAG: hypothetical protein A4E71_00510 [Smithella sp. PtaU1.Bin162]